MVVTSPSPQLLQLLDIMVMRVTVEILLTFEKKDLPLTMKVSKRIIIQSCT